MKNTSDRQDKFMEYIMAMVYSLGVRSTEDMSMKHIDTDRVMVEIGKDLTWMLESGLDEYDFDETEKGN